MIEYFKDWALKTADIKELTTTVNSSGQVVEGETTIASGLKVNYWTDNSQETNVNDKFVDQATGSMLVKNSAFTPNTKQWAEIDGKVHYITGVDDVGGLGEFYVLKWRREL